jgi:5,6-dimethylbenzimidazole synthase
MPAPAIQENPDFSAEERAAVYRCIHTRRDVRGQFLPDPVQDEQLARILKAAHYAPSVGFMQPWDFIVVRAPEVKARVKAAFDKAHAEAAMMFGGDKRETYRKLKLEGIVESPVNVCITCDRSRTGPVVIGRTHMPEMDLFSAVCAVQNFWLAARAENLGVGWVSIADRDDLRAALGIPPHIHPIAYLCLGRVSHFYDKPELESAGWLPRTPMKDVTWFDQWQQQSGDEELLELLK